MESTKNDSHRVIFKDLRFEDITETFIARHTAGGAYPDPKSCQHITPQSLEINEGTFASKYGTAAFPPVTVVRQEDQLLLSCGCHTGPGKLCEHQALVLAAIIKRDELSVFFDGKCRQEALKKVAGDYGLENEPDLDRFFQIAYRERRLHIAPRLPSLIPVTRESLQALNEQLIPEPAVSFKQTANRQTADVGEPAVCVVLRQHKYYKHLCIELYTASATKDGKIKNPLNPIQPLDLIWETEDHDRLKFLAGINKFQNHPAAKRSESDIAALRAIVRNPAGYNFYYHNEDVSENITAGSLVPVKVGLLRRALSLTVNFESPFYELSGTLETEDGVYALKDLNLRFTYFVLIEHTLCLVDDIQALGVIDLFKKRPANLLIHASRYKEFRTQLLAKLGDRVTIEYQYVEAATPVQLQQQGFHNETERIIYLSDSGDYVLITPVMRYGETEVPVRTKRQIYAVDNKGKEFTVKRNDREEIQFSALLVKQHPWFKEQLSDGQPYFYLHKKRFLEEEWFLNAFEEWRRHKISIRGFNEIEGNNLTPEKVEITIRVLSGMNWFNTEVNVKFGRKKASLKKLQKAIRNKSKYVELDDGTMGILPAEWIERFSDFFNSGEITDKDILRIPKVNFSAVEALYEEEMLDDRVKQEIREYKEKLAGFESVKDVDVPPELTAVLRPYQLQGLNWLNFLDDFNFGGCLADDMGLGKSLQIIAFILSQRNKAKHNTNLLVVPASLIFNWQREVEKFAPSLKIHTIYGAERAKNTDNFDCYEIILTSYGTLLSDVNFLKDYNFNYILLDESQNIKNPGSQRYRAVRLLKSRNKIVITGTPVENNTFDLYGQISFACPGLLGSKRYFRDIYSSPIDKFKNSKRAAELQHKIRPFILRRTKKQVAGELPDKTETILYCEMGPAQRKVYDDHEKEFREYISATTGEELKKSSMNVLKGLTKLRQICDSPLLLSGDKTSCSESAKISTLVEQIKGQASQHKILVFSQFVSMLELIKKELIASGTGFAWLSGSTRNREAAVNDFQNNAQTRVFLISLKAGGIGLNLTEADYVYLVDPWWNPAVENQAIDRSHRIGQNKNVIAVRLICPGTVEEKILQIQESKKALAGDLVRSDSSFIQSLSKNELLNLLEQTT